MNASKTTLRQSVWSLYRQFLRTARAKDPDGSLGLTATVKEQFRSSCDSVGRREFQRIEFMLREGHKKLKLIKMDGVTAVGTRWGAKR